MNQYLADPNVILPRAKRAAIIAALGALIAVASLAMSIAGFMGFSTPLNAMLGLVVVALGIAVVVRALHIRHRLVSRMGTGLSVSPSGISVFHLGIIPWSNVYGVLVIDTLVTGVRAELGDSALVFAVTGASQAQRQFGDDMLIGDGDRGVISVRLDEALRLPQAREAAGIVAEFARARSIPVRTADSARSIPDFSVAAMTGTLVAPPRE